MCSSDLLQLDDDEREVVAAAHRALARLFHQEFAGVARRQGVEHGADFIDREVVPQPVAARHDGVAQLQARDVVRIQPGQSL